MRTANIVVTRRVFVAHLAGLGGALAATFSTSHAQPTRARRIGAVIGDDPEGGFAAFKATLRELGHIEGENLQIEERDSLRAGRGLILPPPRAWT